jgi:Lipase maturation factor
MGCVMSWRARLLVERGLAAIYFVAFLVAANQFVPLAGAHGLTPATAYISRVPFRYTPSLFYLNASDWTFQLAAWTGVVVSLSLVTGLASRAGSATAATAWGVLWLLYLSFVNVGGLFYGFGWEMLLLEAGLVAVFLGSRTTVPTALTGWLLRWISVRLMFGAGLIKLRGDGCWRDLTCLDYYFETQPMPNPLSWYFHWLPLPVHHAGVVVNHVVELIVPFFLLMPQPVAGMAALVTIAFQLALIVSGNLSWLNWLTIVVACAALDDRLLRWIPDRVPVLTPPGRLRQGATAAFAVLVAMLSVNPVVNLLSPGQVMNTSFEPLHVVNTYGAFGSITRERNEIVIEGTIDPVADERATWRAYEFKGKPGDPARQPRQFAPYHLRLDWLMWFAAMGAPADEPWFGVLLRRLLEADPGVLGLLAYDPFDGRRPTFVRAESYTYHFTTPEEHARTGRWWTRTRVGPYYPAVSLH